MLNTVNIYLKKEREIKKIFFRSKKGKKSWQGWGKGSPAHIKKKKKQRKFFRWKKITDKNMNLHK